MKTLPTTASELTAPAGMAGLACEPWTPGEIYAVAANWAQASAPVMVYGLDGWDIDEHGRQVADFRHSPREAMDSILREAVMAGGDEPTDGEIEAYLEDCIEISAD